MPTPIKYTPELIQDLQARYNITATPEQLAAELGTPVGYLKTRISALRKDGFVFAYGKFVNEGETKVKTRKDGSTETFEKVNGKWQYVIGSYTGKTDFTVQRNRTKKYARKPRKPRKVSQRTAPPEKVAVSKPETAKQPREVVTRTNENKKAPLYTNANPKAIVIKEDAAEIARKIAAGWKHVEQWPKGGGKSYLALRSPDKLAS